MIPYLTFPKDFTNLRSQLRPQIVKTGEKYTGDFYEIHKLFYE